MEPGLPLKEGLSIQRKLHNANDLSGSEDEVGRTAFSGKASRTLRHRLDREITQAISTQAPSVDNSAEAAQTTSDISASKKRSGSYLDEVLLARSEKRRKRERNRRGQR